MIGQRPGTAGSGANNVQSLIVMTELSDEEEVCLNLVDKTMLIIRSVVTSMCKEGIP